MEDWTEEATYDAEIYPLMSQIIAICRAHQIPVVCTFQYADSEEDGPALCTTILTEFARTSEKMLDLAKRHGPRMPVALAETIETRPDGSKHITIRRIS